MLSFILGKLDCLISVSRCRGIDRFNSFFGEICPTSRRLLFAQTPPWARVTHTQVIHHDPRIYNHWFNPIQGIVNRHSRRGRRRELKELDDDNVSVMSLNGTSHCSFLFKTALISDKNYQIQNYYIILNELLRRITTILQMKSYSCHCVELEKISYTCFFLFLCKWILVCVVNV